MGKEFDGPFVKPGSLGGEENEVDEIKWIPLDEINNYEWAFSHADLIRKYAFGKLKRKFYETFL
jgi:8-oxo-dGTP pyrophosphatase MutT (NUDIX family)